MVVQHSPLAQGADCHSLNVLNVHRFLTALHMCCPACRFAQPLLELDPDLLCEEPQGASPAVRERQWQQLFEMWREEWSGFLKVRLGLS